MKLVQKIMSRGLTIGIIVAAVLAYNNRADIFPQWFGDTARTKTSRAGSAPAMPPKNEATVVQAETAPIPDDDTAMVETPAPVEHVSAAMPADTPVGMPDDSADSTADGSEQQAARYRPEHEGMQDPLDAAESGMDDAASSSVSEDGESTAETMPETAVVEEDRPAPVEIDPVEAASQEAVPQQGAPQQGAPQQGAPQSPAAEPVQHEAASGDVLAQARAAYWDGDYATAELAYQQAAGLDENNPDVYGELGNLYYAQGKWHEAAGAYFEAGTRLIGNGERDRVQHLLVVMRGLDQDLAGKLEAMTAAQ